MISSFNKFLRILIKWLNKLFLIMLIFVGKYIIWVILLLLRLVEKICFLVLYEIGKFNLVFVNWKVVFWVVFFLVVFVDWKGYVVNFLKNLI